MSLARCWRGCALAISADVNGVAVTLLSICTNASNNVGVSAPTSVIGSGDPAALRLLQMARRTCMNLSQVDWVALVVEHVFIASGSTTFTLPSDYDRLVDGTLWDRSRYWEMRGPMSPQQWQMYKSSLFSQASVQRRWRIRLGSGDAVGGTANFEIDPPLSAADTSSTFVFEYVSKNWCRSATTYSLEQPVIVSGGTGYVLNNLLTVVGGTSTTTATMRVTKVAAGVITAAQVEVPGVYTVIPTTPFSVTGGAGSGATFTSSTTTIPGTTLPDWAADTDTALLDEDLIELGVIWRLQQRLGLAYAEEKDEYERQVRQAIARDGGMPTLCLAASGEGYHQLDSRNIPESGYGS